MGVTLHVSAIKEPNEKWKKMKDIYNYCVELKIEVPDEIVEYFDGNKPL